ncbi:hypothetical protein RU97_GL001838 [Enterococcus canis]|uniref:Uncharacterized protein n=1 Tax=Enterococcus canis TaxID=214095 RepID=A0A1L8RF80_9ENTE|nr:DUF805 domain-containing protein [Enterococcus canis]OJG18441.1 hypothetical protein RU97_GL001838 [Enterococcus canis]
MRDAWQQYWQQKFSLTGRTDRLTFWQVAPVLMLPNFLAVLGLFIVRDMLLHVLSHATLQYKLAMLQYLFDKVWYFPPILAVVTLVFALVTLIPTFNLVVRRLRDVGLSSALMGLLLLCLYGSPVLLLLSGKLWWLFFLVFPLLATCLASDPVANELAGEQKLKLTKGFYGKYASYWLYRNQTYVGKFTGSEMLIAVNSGDQLTVARRGSRKHRQTVTIEPTTKAIRIVATRYFSGYLALILVIFALGMLSKLLWLRLIAIAILIMLTGYGWKNAHREWHLEVTEVD